MSTQPNDLLIRAQAGEDFARNELIDSFRPFILKVAANFCKRRLDWSNDEELSVAMIAFNEAIDTFDPKQGAAWSSYAYLVINRRLTDYMRKENKYKNLSILQDDFSEFTSAIAYDEGQDFERIFWQDEIHSMLHKLKEYGISMHDLVSATPKHKRVQLKLAYIAHKMSTDEYFHAYIKKNRRLPVKEISLRFNVRRKFIETWRRYLLTLFLIITDKDLIMVKEFVGSIVEEGINKHANN